MLRNAAYISRIRKTCLGFSDAHSQEFNPDTTHPMVHIMADQDGVTDLGGTLRLGSYPCVLTEGSKAYELYGEKEIHKDIVIDMK